MAARYTFEILVSSHWSWKFSGILFRQNLNALKLNKYLTWWQKTLLLSTIFKVALQRHNVLVFTIILKALNIYETNSLVFDCGKVLYQIFLCLVEKLVGKTIELRANWIIFFLTINTISNNFLMWMWLNHRCLFDSFLKKSFIKMFTKVKQLTFNLNVKKKMSIIKNIHHFLNIYNLS